MSDANRWVPELGVSGGHRYFSDFGSGPDRSALPHRKWRVAVADRSGDYPDETDDGVMYLDRRRPITMPDYPIGLWLIPLVSTDGKEYSTPANRAEAELVAERFRMEIIDHPW